MTASRDDFASELLPAVTRALAGAMDTDTDAVMTALDEISARGYAAMYSACCAFAVAALHDQGGRPRGPYSLTAQNVVTGDRVSVDQVADPGIVAAMRFLACYGNDDLDTCLAIFLAVEADEARAEFLATLLGLAGATLRTLEAKRKGGTS